MSKDDGQFNIKRMQLVAKNTMTRGPHAFGFAWIDSRDRLRCFKQTGRIADHLGLLAMAHDAKMLIGHCRYATQGDPENNGNNHPHSSDAGWIVHNGMIHNYRQLLAHHDLAPVSDCDSEVLGLLIEKLDGTLMERCVGAVLETSRSPLVLMGLWARPHRMILVRRGNPLHQGETKGGFYLASLPDELPGKISQFKDGEGVELS